MVSLITGRTSVTEATFRQLKSHLFVWLRLRSTVTLY